MNFEYNNDFVLNDLGNKPLKVYTYPSPVLKKIAEEISEVNLEVKTLASDMIKTMYLSRGIGLAAPQVGKSLRLFVSDINFEIDDDNEDLIKNPSPKVYINPKITKKNGETTYEEGCLSFPGIYEKVTRYESITMEFLDIDGKPQTIEATGLESICLQHELDHLNGIVFIEKLSTLKQQFLKRKFLKSQKR